MPGFDGTGPKGQGPRTGGGRGFCSPESGASPSGDPYWNYRTRYYPYASYCGVGRGGLPGGGGRGRAFGGGRGRRWCW